MISFKFLLYCYFGKHFRFCFQFSNHFYISLSFYFHFQVQYVGISFYFHFRVQYVGHGINSTHLVTMLHNSVYQFTLCRPKMGLYLTLVWQCTRVVIVIIGCCLLSPDQQMKAQKCQNCKNILCNHYRCEINFVSITITFNVL